MSSIQFNRVWYDRKRNRVHHWWTIDGQRFHDVDDITYAYYVPDDTGTSEWKDLSGNPVKRCTIENKYELNAMVDSLYPNIHEADLNSSIVYLHDKYEKVKLTSDMDNINICYIDIETAAEDEFTHPDQAKYPINLITCHFTKSDRTVTWGLYEYNGTKCKEFRYFADEVKMLEDFITIFRKENVDIISGWNISGFDIPYIVNRCNNLNIKKSLSPVNEYYKNKHGEYEICGIADLDYLRLYRDKFEFTTKESYKLDWVGVYELGEGKLQLEGEISDQWKNDWDNHVDYNIQDVMLVKKLENKKKYIELSVNIAFQALIPFDKVFSTIAMHTGLILNHLHANKMVMPCRNKNPEKRVIPGGHVYAESGLHKYMVSYDVESLYPHLIMMYNIGPETLRLNCEGSDQNIQRTPLTDYKTWDTSDGPAYWGGISYDKSRTSILSTIVKSIFEDRKKFKRMQKLAAIKDPSSLDHVDKKLWDIIQDEHGTPDYYDKQQHIRKIQINSLYGALGNEYFNLYNLNNAVCITLSGQHFIKYARECVNDYFKSKHGCKEEVVKLLDTDSLYFSLDEMLRIKGIEFANDKEACDWINEFIKSDINPLVKRFVGAYTKFFSAPNILNFRSEKIIKNYFIAGMKNYAMHIISDEGTEYVNEDGPKFKVMGIKTKKSDSSKALKDIGTEVLKLILDNKSKDEVNDYYREQYKLFKTLPIEDIAIPGKSGTYNELFPHDMNYYIKNGFNVPTGADYRAKAAFYYNYFIKKHKLKLMPISSGSKMSLVYVDKNNSLKCSAMAFVGKWPVAFNKDFEIDYDKMWNSVESAITNWFEVLGWGTPQKVKNSFNSFFS